MKFIISTCLAVVLCLLLLPHVLKSRQALLERAGLESTDAALTTDLRQAIQASLANGSPPPLPEIEAAERSRQPLPRDPFAIRALAIAQAQAAQSLAQTEQAPPPQELPPSPQGILHLQATAIDRHGALAFINGEVLTVGQSILGYTITHIDVGQVALTANGTTVSLYLDDHLKP
jgi:hypothetical protein